MRCEIPAQTKTEYPDHKNRHTKSREKEQTHARPHYAARLYLRQLEAIQRLLERRPHITEELLSLMCLTILKAAYFSCFHL
jgi:hypothetical protein